MLKTISQANLENVAEISKLPKIADTLAISCQFSKTFPRPPQKSPNLPKTPAIKRSTCPEKEAKIIKEPT